ncbi:MAG: ABC transporter substrate-binding protein [Eubacterium sp.]|nr:ABC transporter substrate-binding protein [Eubacterium sp.]
MNKFVKRLMTGIVGVALVAGLAAGCSNGSGSGDAASSDQVTVGVIQYATHPSLDNCYEGFVQGLEEGGFKEGENLTIDFTNAQGDAANGDMAAKNMVSKNYDLITGIATPAAMSAYAATKDSGTPVVFTAVSDPVSAGIVKSLEAPGTNCTGTADVLPLEAQMKMIRAFLPDAKTIGILYTTSEPNSVSHLKKFKELAKNYDFEIVEVGVTNASEVAAAAETLVSKGVDCINNFTDNNVVDNLSTVLKAANDAKIPVFGSEVEQVKNGCLASESIDYVALGRDTGLMAAKILKGEAKPEDMPVQEVKESAPVYNKEVMESLGLTLPQDYSDAEAVSADE